MLGIAEGQTGETPVLHRTGALLPDLDQAVAFVPARAHVTQGCVDFCLRDFCVWTGQDRGGFAFGGFEQLAIADQVGDLKAGHACLARAEEFTWAAKL